MTVPLRRILVMILLVLGGLYMAVSLKATQVPSGDGLHNHAGQHVGNDFLGFYAAARMVLAGDQAATYDTAAIFAVESQVIGDEVKFPWGYPPTMLLLVAPLGLLGYLPATYVWLAAPALAFAGMIRRASRLWLAAAVSLPPITHNLVSGQTGNLAAAIIAGGLLLLPSHPILAGSLLGLLACKPQMALLLPFCLAGGRHWRAVAAMAVSGSGFAALSLLILGADPWLAFLDHLPQHLAYAVEGRLPIGRMPTIFALALRLGFDPAQARLWQLAAFLAVAGLAALVWRRSGDLLPRSLVLLAAIPFTTPFLLEYDLALAALPCALLMMKAWQDGLTALEWPLLLVLWSLPAALWAITTAAGLPVGPAILSFLLTAAFQMSRPQPIAAKPY